MLRLVHVSHIDEAPCGCIGSVRCLEDTNECDEAASSDVMIDVMMYW
jgi:hypothetical protein